MATQQDSKLGCNEADKSPTCLVCGQDVRRPQVVDVPEGGVQLRDWIQSLVQACDCFGLSVVGPIVDGGEASAVAYSTDVALCQFCRDLLVADCDDFDQEDLIGDWLEPDEESILDSAESATVLHREQCTRWSIPDSYEESPAVDENNWKEVVLRVINELREGLNASIDYSLTAENSITVTVAGEPIPLTEYGNSEALVSRFVITLLISGPETDSAPDTEVHVVSGAARERDAGRSVLCIERRTFRNPFLGDCVVGMDSFESLRRTIQLVIAEEMYYES